MPRPRKQDEPRQWLASKHLEEHLERAPFVVASLHEKRSSDPYIDGRRVNLNAFAIVRLQDGLFKLAALEQPDMHPKDERSRRTFNPANRPASLDLPAVQDESDGREFRAFKEDGFMAFEPDRISDRIDLLTRTMTSQGIPVASQVGIIAAVSSPSSSLYSTSKALGRTSVATGPAQAIADYRDGGHG